jgi:hypothetical protein
LHNGLLKKVAPAALLIRTYIFAMKPVCHKANEKPPDSILRAARFAVSPQNLTV